AANRPGEPPEGARLLFGRASTTSIAGVPMRSSLGGDPTPEDSVRKELASIFAAAILRLRKHPDSHQGPSTGHSATCLEVPPKTGLIGHRG
ncbi:MAG: hypothetical protein ACKOAU_06655, partial [Pirellula sp.]